MLRFLSALFVSLLTAGWTIVGAQSLKATQSVNSVLSKKAQTVTPATYTGRQMAVGQGGGFTGASTTYFLLDNGQLFVQHDLDTTYAQLTKQKASTTKRLFTTLESKGRIKSTRFNHPGNTYRFVQWRRGGQLYRVTWGAASQPVPPAYPKFYESFAALIPAASLTK